MEARGEEELTKKKFIERVLGAHRIGEKAGELGRNLDTSGRPGGRTYKDSSEQEEVDRSLITFSCRISVIPFKPEQSSASLCFMTLVCVMSPGQHALDGPSVQVYPMLSCD